MTAPSIRSILTIRDEGFVTAGVVVGAATYQVLPPMGCRVASGSAFAYRRAMVTQQLEYTNYIQGVTKTWTDAIDRLDREARSVGAHGVVGVTVRADHVANQSSIFQVQLYGTGVIVERARPLARPFLSMLSMAETEKLLLRGWIPSGIGFGMAALHVHGWHQSPLYQRGALLSNVEFDEPTLRANQARRDAERRLRLSPTVRGAQGVVGTNTDVSITPDQCYQQQGLKIIAQMTGTGVVRFGPPTVPIDVSYPLRAKKVTLPDGR